MKAWRYLLAGALGGAVVDACLTLIAVGDPGGWAPWRVALVASPCVAVGMAIGLIAWLER